MLGLKLDIVIGAMNVLISDGYVAREPNSDGADEFHLTDAGKSRLLVDRLEVPQEEMIVVDYDGVRRIPLRLTGESVVRAAMLQGTGAVQIRPYPADAPGVDDLAIPEISKVIRRQKSEDFRRTVLSLKRIVRRNNLFREGVALVYAAEKSDEVQVAFVIEDKLADAYELAFAQNGGPKKMGFVRAVAETDLSRKLEKMVGRTIYRSMADRNAMKAARKLEVDSLVEADSVRQAAAGSQMRRSGPLAAALAAAEKRLETASREMDAFEVRPLACYEQTELLDTALKKARKSLVITSAGLQPHIVNPARLREIDLLIGEGVQIEVESYYAVPAEARSGGKYDPLWELARRGAKGLTIRKGVSQDFFFLVQDDELAVISTRPFFGEASRRTGFMRVQGLVTRKPEFVEEIRSIVLGSSRPVRRNGN
ncbi:hypothetical protein JJC00_06540 [Bradyrhizobium diazoefficiens]|uniref:hypothetical protein n=1 Tax=Bradyrhizobium diazoefficiens TaxID=1355477 RepID=UPI00190AEEAC|nr:hypothetical protein [Bradyrhizobium diazoefficiens]QQO35337.1 hypothetical protein JJC00_06540 [Bradyrhizobium diazoefficiens]